MGKSPPGIRGKMGKKSGWQVLGAGRQRDCLWFLCTSLPSLHAGPRSQAGAHGKAGSPCAALTALPAVRGVTRQPPLCPPQHHHSCAREKERKLNMRQCRRGLQTEPPQDRAPLSFQRALGWQPHAPLCSASTRNSASQRDLGDQEGSNAPVTATANFSAAQQLSEAMPHIAGIRQALCPLGSDAQESSINTEGLSQWLGILSQPQPRLLLLAGFSYAIVPACIPEQHTPNLPPRTLFFLGSVGPGRCPEVLYLGFAAPARHLLNKQGSSPHCPLRG